ncbi:LURP-one-related protein [Dioscorea alata]|uniref:LURP-one-related protein n=1 Tax=Dioscorea alata TaxID=55571 RepID=A0ACB7V0C5_DIOAL|nr:LURP-one-related protein [Dioscorea alata]
MDKIHPSSSSSNDANSMKEVYTIWMKSLILNGNGCTIYDSMGNLVYRVDNYDSKCRCEVYVMDQSGRVLLKLLRKKLRVFGRWEGYKCNGSNEEMKPWFRVKKRFLKGKESYCEVWDDNGHLIYYKVVGLPEKSSYKITDLASNIVAEVNRKQTRSGVILDDDVLTLKVEPNIDQSLIMGLVVVQGLINHRM